MAYHDYLRSREQRNEAVKELQAQAMLALFERRYWTRLWIVQEILMARSVQVLCGESRLSLEDLRDYLSSKMPNYAGPASSLINDKETQGEGAFKPFLTLGMAVFKYVDQDCADVRDKVFGLPGLVDFKDQAPIKPAAEEVYDLILRYFEKDPKMTESEVEYFSRVCRECMGLF